MNLSTLTNEQGIECEGNIRRAVYFPETSCDQINREKRQRQKVNQELVPNFLLNIDTRLISKVIAIRLKKILI